MSEAGAAPGTHAPGGVAAARRALLAWVDEAGAEGRAFLQVLLRAEGSSRYSIRHLDDRELPAGALRRLDDPYAARNLAQTRADGEHRPLKTAPNLRRGWLLDALDARGLWTALDYLYPAAAVHWHAGRDGTLRVTPWAETAGRQSGIYSAVGLLPDAAVHRAVRACCADAVCLRRVAWGVRAGDPPLPTGDAASRDAERVPCPEACSMFIAFARQVLRLERAPREEVPGLGPLAKSEVEQLCALVRAAADGTLGAARDGDFDEPTNPRRIRYLATRLTAD